MSQNNYALFILHIEFLLHHDGIIPTPVAASLHPSLDALQGDSLEKALWLPASVPHFLSLHLYSLQLGHWLHQPSRPNQVAQIKWSHLPSKLNITPVPFIFSISPPSSP